MPKVMAKAARFFVANAHNGMIIHGDPKGLPAAQEFEIDVRDYARFRDAGGDPLNPYIEPIDELEDVDPLTDADRPVGTGAIEALRALGFDRAAAIQALRAVAGTADVTGDAEHVTALESRNTTAHPQDTGKILSEAPEDEVIDDPDLPPPPAKRGPGRPPKSAAAPAAAPGTAGADNGGDAGTGEDAAKAGAAS